MRNADLVVCTGAELEVGWLPSAPAASRATGRCSRAARLLRGGAQRAHAGGAGQPRPRRRATSMPPAIRTSRPIRATSPLVATALAARLQQLDPANAADYRSAAPISRGSWQQADATLDSAGGAAAAACRWCRNTRAWSTWTTGSACSEVGALEPKPGVPPSAAAPGSSWSATLQATPARHGTHAAYEDPRRLGVDRRQRTGMPVVMLPFTVGGTEARQGPVRLVRRHRRAPARSRLQRK